MDKLLAYLSSLQTDAQIDFATRCQTTVGYLRKAAYTKQQLGDGLCLRIAAESSGAVMPEDLRPDVNWQYLRQALTNSGAQAPANTAQAATESIAQGVANV